MKRSVIATALCLFAAAALADSPHYVTGPDGQVSSTTGSYDVSFKEAGLGNSPVTYTLAAQFEQFTWQCFTKSGNKPQGSPNSTSFSDETTQTTLKPRNGQITGMLSLVPQQGGSCNGNGLKLCLIAAEYTGVSLNDGTSTVPLPNGSASFSTPICPKS